MAKVFAEFVGTFALVFTVCQDNVAGGSLGALSVASVLMVAVYALGSVSGAHFNPAVSFGVLLVWLSGQGDFQPVMACLYMGSQLLAGLAAGLLASTLWSSTLGGPSSTDARTAFAIEAGNMTHPATALGTPGHYSHATVFGTEVLYTALLVFVVLNVAICRDEGEKEKNHYFAISIGFVIVSGASAIGHISGCSLNPAVSAGVATSAAVFGDGASISGMALQFLLYTAAEMLGGALAFWLFAICRRHWLHASEDAHSDKEAEPSLASKLFAEFLGTYVLCLTVALVVVQAGHVPVVGVVGIASSLMVMIFSLAKVSGANFNPAVSLGLLLIGEMSLVNFASYVVAQLVGGCAAIGTAAVIERRKWRVALVADLSSRSKIVTLAKGSWGAIFGAEVFYTFLLVFVVLNVAVRDAPNQYYGMAIGFVIVAGGVASGGLSGGCFNPAVALSLDFAGMFSPPGAKYGRSLVYVAAELLGAALATAVYRTVSQREEQSEENVGERELLSRPNDSDCDDDGAL